MVKRFHVPHLRHRWTITVNGGAKLNITAPHA